MKKIICRMALVLAVASLAGCGLKGPLYFPPQEKSQQQTIDGAETVPAQRQETSTDQSTTAPAQDGTERQPASPETDTQSAQ